MRLAKIREDDYIDIDRVVGFGISRFSELTVEKKCFEVVIDLDDAYRRVRFESEDNARKFLDRLIELTAHGSVIDLTEQTDE